MNIKRIKYSVVLLMMFFSFVNLVHASVVINEVQISPTEGRFIELYNSGDNSIDLTNWYLQRKTATGTFGSMVTKTNFEGKSIDANGYFLISKSGLTGADIVIDTLTLTESNTIQLKDGSGNVINKVGWGETNDCQNPCAPNPTSDQSISRTSNGEFAISTPTPREINGGTVSNDTQESSTTTSNASTSSTSSAPKEIPIIYKIATKIIAPRIVTAGIPFDIDHLTTGIHKEKITTGKFVWNFGDGRQKQLSVSDPFNYTYDYPGEYVLTLSFYDSSFNTKPDAIDRLTIKVIPSGVVISSVGTYIDPFVEIENNSNYEMSLNKWIMKGSVHSFLIPEGMVILPNKKLKLSPKITGFDFNDLDSISIIDTSGQVFATYPTKKTYSENYYSNNNSQGNIVKADIVTSDQVADIANSPDVINLNDLGANAGSSGNGLNNTTLIYLGLAGIIAIGLLSIFLIRRKNEIPDYVEKGISASDMTIME